MLKQIAMNGGVSDSYSYKKSRLKHSKNEFDTLDDIVIEEKLYWISFKNFILLERLFMASY